MVRCCNVGDVVKFFLCRNVPDVELLAANEKFYIGNDLNPRHIGG